MHKLEPRLNAGIFHEQHGWPDFKKKERTTEVIALLTIIAQGSQAKTDIWSLQLSDAASATASGFDRGRSSMMMRKLLSSSGEAARLVCVRPVWAAVRAWWQEDVPPCSVDCNWQ